MQALVLLAIERHHVKDKRQQRMDNISVLVTDKGGFKWDSKRIY